MTALRVKLLFKWRWTIGTLATVSVGLLSVPPCPEASSLMHDEEVILFNTSAGNQTTPNRSRPKPVSAAIVYLNR